ncbi:hypothetical protein [Hymenobacter qilianensis]|uniref:hypothetical protein n=1 Tax=Hymenobacter qilianensis TaxID=1385715 RepID=UPI001E459F4E|nr:hypothetical protein [Hymenobacter qilianensis]
MKLLLISLLSLCISLSGCSILGIDQCEGPRNARETYFSIVYLNSNNTQSIFIPPLSYSRDSVRVLDETGNIVPQDQPINPSTYTLIFPLLEPGKDHQLGTPITRQFIIYLTQADQDTIRASYELFENDCNKLDFKVLTVFTITKRYMIAIIHT